MLGGIKMLYSSRFVVDPSCRKSICARRRKNIVRRDYQGELKMLSIGRDSIELTRIVFSAVDFSCGSLFARNLENIAPLD